MKNVVQGVPCVRNDEQGVNRFQGWGWLLGSITLVALSAAVNVRHAVGTTTGYADIAEAGAFAVAMTVGFVALPAYGLRMAREGARALAVAAFVGTLVCGAVSFTNLVGASMKHRLTAAVEATDETGKRADTRKAIKTAEGELATIGTTRPSATIQAEIDAKMTSRRDLAGCEAKWLPSSRARSVCIEVNKFRAEKGIAERREALQRTISDAQAKLGAIDAGKTVGSADTAAIVLAAKMGGWSVSPEAVDLAKSVGTGLGVELLGALLLAGWDRSRGKITQIPRASVHAVLPPAQSSPDIGSPVASAVFTPVVPTERSDRTEGENSPEAGDATARQRIIDRLKENAGSVRGSQRALAKEVGVSPSRFNTVLRDMAERGMVSVRTGATGTVVTLS
ncbi:MAG: winged helix-turn-helix domain-containing protein [Hyphomicrobiaceae bacterium]